MWLLAILSIDLLFCGYLWAVDQENSKSSINSSIPSTQEAGLCEQQLPDETTELKKKFQPGQDFPLAEFIKYRDISLHHCSTIFELGNTSLLAEIVHWYEEQSNKPLYALGKKPVADRYSSDSFDAEIWALVQAIDRRPEYFLWKFEHILTLNNLFKVDRTLIGETLGLLIKLWRQLSPEDQANKWIQLPSNGQIMLINEARLLGNHEINQKISELKELSREKRLPKDKKRPLISVAWDKGQPAKLGADPSTRKVE